VHGSAHAGAERPFGVPNATVVASGLTGFGGGLLAKAALLELDGVDVDGTKPTSRVHPEVIPLDL
jgi:hypothetical protein